MNRRNFLAGLLATTAAVPLAKAVPFSALREYGNEVVAAFDLASGPDTTAITYSWVQQRMFYAMTVDGMLKSAMNPDDFTRWGPEPGTVWFGQWDVMRQILDDAPVPDVGRVILSDGVTPLDS